MNSRYDHGPWPMVIISSLIFVIFAFSFTYPKNWRDRSSLGSFLAFFVALLKEKFGFLLKIYPPFGWLGSRFPELDLFPRSNGHLWKTIFDDGADSLLATHFNLLHVFSNVLNGGGFVIIASAWRVRYKEQRNQTLATTGACAYSRHPRYIGIVAVLLGFVVQWTTILTLVVFPALAWRLV